MPGSQPEYTRLPCGHFRYPLGITPAVQHCALPQPNSARIDQVLENDERSEQAESWLSAILANQSSFQSKRSGPLIITNTSINICVYVCTRSMSAICARYACIRSRVSYDLPRRENSGRTLLYPWKTIDDNGSTDACGFTSVLAVEYRVLAIILKLTSIAAKIKYVLAPGILTYSGLLVSVVVDSTWIDNGFIYRSVKIL